MSADCLRKCMRICVCFKNFAYACVRLLHAYTAFAYVYGFCICLCTVFAHVVRILRTYTAYLLRKLCGFFLRIRLLCTLCGFCVRIRLIFCARCAAFAYIYAYLHGVQMRTVSRNLILWVPRFILSVQTLVIRGKS